MSSWWAQIVDRAGYALAGAISSYVQISYVRKQISVWALQISNGVAMERYLVYCQLMRNGYLLMRCEPCCI